MLKELKKYLMVQRIIREINPNKKTIFILVGDTEISNKIQHIFHRRKYRTQIIANSKEFKKILLNSKSRQFFFIMVDSNYKKYFDILIQKDFPLTDAIVLPIYRL